MFIYAFLHQQNVQEYSPENQSNIDGYISTLVLEEAIHTARKNASIGGKTVTIDKLIEQLYDYSAGFFTNVNENDNFNMKGFDGKLVAILGKLSSSNMDLGVDQTTGKQILETMDILHLITADNGMCNIFLTRDRGFLNLGINGLSILRGYFKNLNSSYVLDPNSSTINRRDMIGNVQF